jgi:hypothetical protein
MFYVVANLKKEVFTKNKKKCDYWTAAIKMNYVYFPDRHKG